MKEALLIVDMSNDYVSDDGVLTIGRAAQDIVPYILNLATDFFDKDNVIVVAMDAHAKNKANFNTWPPHNILGTEGQKLYGELFSWYEKNRFNDNVLYLPKANYNAFFNTQLAEKLKELDVDTVHVTGVTTDICVFLTVAGADAEGFQTVVHKHGTATFTNKGEMLLQHMHDSFQTKIIE